MFFSNVSPEASCGRKLCTALTAAILGRWLVGFFIVRLETDGGFELSSGSTGGESCGG